MFNDRASTICRFLLSTMVVLTLSGCSNPDLSGTRLVTHGSISSIEIPQNWQQETAPPFLDPRQETLTYIGPNAGSRISFRVLRKPGRALSSNFVRLLKESPRTLSAAESKLIAELIAYPILDLSLSDAMRECPEPVSIKDATIDNVGARTVVTGFVSSYLVGCSQTAELNGNYSTRFILADADGKGGAIEEVLFASQERDFSETDRIARQALSSVKWKPLNEK